MPRAKVQRPVDRRVRFRAVITEVLYCSDERERQPETYPANRRCRRCGCRLSIYHPKDARECWPCLAVVRKKC